MAPTGFLLFFTLQFCFAAATLGPRVQTSSGLVIGNDLPGANEFLGIPFAEPTQRFEPPVDFRRKYSFSPLNATDFGPACMQVGDSTEITYGSEDCLFVNVWQPKDALHSSNLPVIVYIYGGSNQYGEAEPYNGSAMAVRHGIVYVSIAYRTGPIGWMAFEEDVKAGVSTGNYGLLDSQSGLRWVQREIRNFGGDPSRVVIHGQSSGAMLVELHLVMPGSRNILSGLVSQSGGLTASPLNRGIDASRAIGKVLGCDPGKLKECLKRVPALSLTSQTYSYPLGPHIDGVTLPDSPLSMLTQGHINNVSVILGAQTNDSFRELSKQFMGKDGRLVPLDSKSYEQRVAGMIPSSKLAKALQLYPAVEGSSVENVHSLGSLTSDRMLCDIRRRATLVNKFHPGHSFTYRFNWYYQSNQNCSSEPNYHPSFLGAIHEDEVVFVMGQPIFMFAGACCGKWGSKLTREPCAQTADCVSCWNPDFGEGYHAYFNEKEWKFSQLVGGLWATFAAYGTPNGASSKEIWPSFKDGSAVTKNIVFDADLQFQHKQEVTPYDNPAICEFWDSVAIEEETIISV